MSLSDVLDSNACVSYLNKCTKLLSVKQRQWCSGVASASHGIHNGCHKFLVLLKQNAEPHKAELEFARTKKFTAFQRKVGLVHCVLNASRSDCSIIVSLTHLSAQSHLALETE